jgi:hypothetical protein
MEEQWGGSLHQTFRLLPKPSDNLQPFLESDGLHKDEVLARLPYDAARAGDREADLPDPKRYRDGKQVYQTAGLLYEDDDGIVRVTDLGRATRRWIPIITEKNARILGRHAAYALAAAQLVNPTGAGRKYNPELRVFPFAFIWRAMLQLDDRISSDELNRALFKVRNEADLDKAIAVIAEAREAEDPELMGEETISDVRKNDRIIPWIALASFGWVLIADKQYGEYYSIRPTTKGLLREASQLRRRHIDFPSADAYIRHLSRGAALPADIR